MSKKVKFTIATFLIVTAIAFPIFVSSQKNHEVLNQSLSDQQTVQLDLAAGTYKITVRHYFDTLYEGDKVGTVTFDNNISMEQRSVSYHLSSTSDWQESISDSNTITLQGGGYIITLDQESGGTGSNTIIIEKQGIFLDVYPQIMAGSILYAIFALLIGIVFYINGRADE